MWFERVLLSRLGSATSFRCIGLVTTQMPQLPKIKIWSELRFWQAMILVTANRLSAALPGPCSNGKTSRLHKCATWDNVLVSINLRFAFLRQNQKYHLKWVVTPLFNFLTATLCYWFSDAASNWWYFPFSQVFVRICQLTTIAKCLSRNDVIFIRPLFHKWNKFSQAALTPLLLYMDIVELFVCRSADFWHFDSIESPWIYEYFCECLFHENYLF